MMKIYSRYDNTKELYELNWESTKYQSVSRMDLSNAMFENKNLRGLEAYTANLSYTCFANTDLTYSTFNYTNLVGADFEGAKLGSCSIQSCRLFRTDFINADLSNCFFYDCDLREADLQGIKVNWQCHTQLAEILRRGADKDVSKRMVAGLIRVSTDWCWDEFTRYVPEELRTWAIEEFRKWEPEGSTRLDSVLRAFAHNLSMTEETN